MIELFLGALVVSAFVMVAPKVVADAYVAIQAAASGAWDFLEKDRARRDAKWGARGRAAAAWAERRRARHQQAGGSGAYGPGVRAYGRDLYAGFWERRIQVADAKRAARPAYVHDPTRPTFGERMEAALRAKVDRLRGGDKEPSTPEPAPPAPLPADLPPGTWTVGPDGQRVQLAKPATAPPATQQAPLTPARAAALADWAAATSPTTTPTPDPVAASAPASPIQPAGGTTMDAEEVQTNEDARRSFKAQMAAAQEAADALAVYEAAQKKLRAAAQAGVDGMAATRFDAQATAAMANVADLIGVDEMSGAAGAIDGIRAAAESGYAALEVYRDSEDLVASKNVAGRTLEPTSS